MSYNTFSTTSPPRLVQAPPPQPTPITRHTSIPYYDTMTPSSPVASRPAPALATSVSGSKRAPVYAYELWRGHNTFCCNGAIMFGSNAHYLLITITLTVVPFVLYTVFIAPSLPWYTLIPSLLFIILTFASMLLAALTEPGIVPPLPDNITLPVPPDPDIDGLTRKYCYICHIYRTRRTKHCRFCSNCVEEFDHHCPWLANCIGRRNYRYYLIFILTLTLFMPYMIALCIYSLMICWPKNDYTYNGFIITVAQQPVAFALLPLFILVFGSTVSLSAYHTTLLFSGQTTNERIRHQWPTLHDSDYNGSIGSNLYRICCMAGCYDSNVNYLLQRIDDAQTMDELARHVAGEELRAARDRAALELAGKFRKPKHSRTRLLQRRRPSAIDTHHHNYAATATTIAHLQHQPQWSQPMPTRQSLVTNNNNNNNDNNNNNNSNNLMINNNDKENKLFREDKIGPDAILNKVIVDQPVIT